MKKLALTFALVATATSASAGNLSEPVMEAPVIVEETAQSSSSAGVVVPLLILAVVAAVVIAD